MICPNCGKEMEPGKLYCENCGEEIKIVPEFDPEIENSINKIMNDVADEVHVTAILEQEKVSGNFDSDSKKDISDIKTGIKLLSIIGGIFIFLILVGGVIWFVVDYRYRNYDYQMQKAQKLVSQGELTEAFSAYRHILDIKPHDSMATYYLANVNFAMGDEESALLLYKEVVALEDGEADIKYNACKSLVDIYVSREDYQSISDFLTAMGDSEIANSFQKYKCNSPSFSYNEGTYDEVVPLKLSTESNGNIFYKLEGDDSTDGYEIYTGPIFLEGGEYRVSAYFVNSFGVESETITNIYHIEVSNPTTPEVLTYSGEFNSPTLIEVDVPEDCKVYYTMDGSEPDDTKILYQGNLHMPIGKSEFKFISYNQEGIPGDIVSRNYELKINTKVSISDAENSIAQGMLESGKIYTLDGLSYEIVGRYIYTYQYCTTISGIGDYYIIGEIMEDQNSIRTRTGALFAVGLYDGKRYRLALDEINNYVFYEF